jgi:hypothetical protein
MYTFDPDLDAVVEELPNDTRDVTPIQFARLLSGLARIATEKSRPYSLVGPDDEDITEEDTSPLLYEWWEEIHDGSGCTEEQAMMFLAAYLAWHFPTMARYAIGEKYSGREPQVLWRVQVRVPEEDNDYIQRGGLIEQIKRPPACRARAGTKDGGADGDGQLCPG